MILSGLTLAVRFALYADGKPITNAEAVTILLATIATTVGTP